MVDEGGDYVARNRLAALKPGDAMPYAAPGADPRDGGGYGGLK